MYDLSNERYFGTYSELLNGVLCCLTYQKLCNGELKLADGSKYTPRTVVVAGVKSTETEAYEAAGMYLWKAACMLANVDENSARFGSMPRLYDTSVNFSSGVMVRWSEEPDDEFWLRGLLHALYSQTSLDRLNIADSFLLDKITIATSVLLEASPLDEEATRRAIAKTWSSSAPIPEIRKRTIPSQPSEQTTTKSGGCYIATAVYGSYDCPQVWTLRRYRDYDLARTRRGRAFIKTYYAISPKMVELFGDSELFKRLWRTLLDFLIKQCRDKGYADTPYEDRHW